MRKTGQWSVSRRVPRGGFYTPPLTTIRQPLTELGAAAVDMINQALSAQKSGSEAPLPQASWGRPRLIVRGSSIRAGENHSPAVFSLDPPG